MFAEYMGRLPQFKVDPIEEERQRRILEKLKQERNGDPPKTYPGKFNEGAVYMRDDILCSILGMQNQLKDWEDPKQQAYQEVMNMIREKYGDLFQPCKL